MPLKGNSPLSQQFMEDIRISCNYRNTNKVKKIRNYFLFFINLLIFHLKSKSDVHFRQSEKKTFDDPGKHKISGLSGIPGAG